jgi:hypothetical protein
VQRRRSLGTAFLKNQIAIVCQLEDFKTDHGWIASHRWCMRWWAKLRVTSPIGQVKSESCPFQFALMDRDPADLAASISTS